MICWTMDTILYFRTWMLGIWIAASAAGELLAMPLVRLIALGKTFISTGLGSECVWIRSAESRYYRRLVFHLQIM